MRKRILIADDYESVLRRVRKMIESQPGWQVCGDAVNGRDALAKAIKLKPDLVILDFAMPHLDGLRAAVEIHKVLPEVPIIMFTMYGSAVEQEAKEFGIARTIDKAQSGTLVATIEELLAQKPPATKIPPATKEVASGSKSISSRVVNPGTEADTR